MPDRDDELEGRLAALARATEPLGARPGFTERVLGRVDAQGVPDWRRGVLRVGRGMLAVAAFSAVLSVVLATTSGGDDDSAVAVTYGMEDMDP
jgi:hypothetical protein